MGPASRAQGRGAPWRPSRRTPPPDRVEILHASPHAHDAAPLRRGTWRRRAPRRLTDEYVARDDATPRTTSGDGAAAPAGGGTRRGRRAGRAPPPPPASR